MSRLLLHISVYKTSHLKKDISAHMGKLAKKKILRLVILFTLLGGNWVKAQHVDTWYTADRAINQAPLPSNGSLELFTPIPTIDGVSVFEWHDFVDFNPLTQIAIQHPNPLNYNQPYPNGFSIGFGTPSFLTPAGSIPDLPTLQMNSVNFNPEILFDGSGNGQALHARSVCREEMTIFIMFRAPGAGTTAETQRLLYGGDIETHHSSTTNLSLGVSNGNRFSIGRTRTLGSDFESGNIDLLGQPAIGVFTRQINGLAAQTERLTTKVNGIPDLDFIRNDVMAQFDTYPFIRLGKHFNSNDPNRNLTGGISEILVADGLLDANSIQRVESYLAIKYGITLNGSASLGSISGNSSYHYLAADGTIIWAIDPTYRFDIAGIGKDRYEDFDAGLPGTTGDLKLRYNLHQRISKSENSEAILTMSTSPNFITDNLDQTRTPINTGGSFSTDHNYLIWGSDRQSIAEVNVELPPLLPQITSRIEREWRVQMNNSTGLTPINGVSVRINLSGSTIIDNGDCALHLMIDTDNDGDFTTGPITLIQATSVDAFGNVYFDGVDFVHQNVFTVGFGDIENPTASNPDSLTVCDTAPAPDPLVVDDEDDNCAVDSVTHISDVSDGLSNPETITRTYRVTDTSGNFTDVQQTINVYTSPNAGSDDNLAICEGDSVTAAQLFAALGGTPDAGGTWSPAPAGAGTYTYTVAATAPCATDATATITVTEQQQPDAGSDDNLAICEGDSVTAAQLFAALGGTPDAGGTWSPAPAGAGTYTYTVAATAPCATDATATITVTEQQQPDAGSDDNLAICEGDSVTAAQLFAALGGTPDAGGTWSPAPAGAGTYTYTVAATAPCATDATATITVTEQQQPDAGSDDNLAICEGDSVTAAQLFAALGGTPDAGGTWSPAPAGAGTYTYTVAATAPCATDATATITVTEQQQPDAGSDDNLAICEGDSVTAAQLFAALGGTPDAGGTWSPAPAGAGTYTYTVAATAPCATDATATITVTEQQQPDAGSDDNLAICEGDSVTAAQLFAALGGTPDAGGTWSPAPAGAGTYTYTVAATAPCATDATATITVTEQQQPDAGSDDNLAICEGDSVTAAQLFAALGGTPDAGGTWSPAPAGAGTYTYTVAATAPCATDATATITVTEQQQPDAGSDDNLAICEGDSVTAAQLFAALGGTPDAGGTWSPAPAGAGTYTYTVAATAPCATDATATITVTEQQQPDAGSDDNLAICEGDSVTAAQLFAALGGTPDAGGTWSPAPAGAGTYTYTVAATAPCATDATATITVTEQQQPDAGSDDNLAICEGDSVTAAQLFAALGGTPDAGGTWSPAPAGAGTYTYTVAATAPCATDATATITVTEQQQPDAGSDDNLAICEGDSVTAAQLFAALGGTPDAGGTWSPAPAGAGTYTYTVAATAPCATDATATITVTEQQQPDAGSDDNLAICEGDSVTAAQLFAALGGTPDAGGTWSPAPAGAGTYTYTVAATAPCATDATATITVTEQQQPDAGSDDNLAICEGDSVTAAQLFAALGGTPDAGGTWSPAPAGAGTYTYTVAATAPCATDATATITVTEQQQPDAGSDDNLAICEGDSVTAAQLFAALGGTPDAGGTWSPAPAGAGTYTYTVAATAPCATDATATITVTEQQQPDAGSDDNLAICEGDSVTAAQLFAALGGTPDAGGTWSPAPAGAGTYTYTVAATAPCATDATATITVTEQQQPDAGSDDNLAICEGDSVTAAQLFAALGGTPDAGGTWSPAPAGAGTYTYTVAATAPCATDATATITVTEQQQPDADNLSNVEACDSYVLPELTNGNYFTGSGGTGTPLSAGDVISTSQTIYIFSPGNGICPYVENSFSVNITGFSVSTHVQHETCWENDNGSVSIEIGDAVFPVTVQLNSMEPMVFNTDSFSITDLSPGNYEMSVIDDTGCETNTNFTILQGGPNLSGSVNVMYLCDANLPSNTIDVTLSDSSISSNVLYALDSTDPNDFILSPDFGNINPGKHSLFILHDNGCVGEITFEVENFEPLELSLTSEYVNQITANVTGGTAPYTYYFDDNDATDSNTYTITRSGAFTVRVIDSNGCEVVQSISMNLMEITIPDFFTPNFDGQNDYWAPRNTKLFPDIETYIFDRYGRKIWTLGPSEAWDGEYDSKPMPSGDYWYIVKLNDGSGREFVGHFTLYR